jgi:Arylsulfotransferase (ASST)
VAAKVFAHTPHSKDAWSFVSAPDLRPMKVQVKTPDPAARPNRLLLDPYAQGVPAGQNGALILDNSGQPIWFDPLDNLLQFNLNLRVQTYRGQPVLTFWHGVVAGSPGHRNLPTPDPEPGGCYEIYNDRYQLLKTVTAVDGWSADQHDFLITPQGDALFTVFKTVKMNLSKYGGPRQGWVGDTGVQEINLATGKLVFSWDMLRHVSLSESEYPASHAKKKASHDIWDAFHMNSLDVGPDHQLLISARNLWTIFDVNMKNGRILWQLGGKKSTFTFPKPDATFSWQHDVQFQPSNQISMFDDGCCANPRQPTPQAQSHGLLLQLDLAAKTATAVKSYYHSPGLQASSEGSYQAMPDGGALISWGSQPYYSQYGPAGNTKGHGTRSLLYDVKLPGSEHTYRTFRQSWTGIPYYPPSAAARKDGSGTDVYASWNGSTQTVAWRVLAGSSPASLRVVASRVSRTGFETRIRVPSGGPYFQVQALDANGKVLRKSGAVRNAGG